MPKAQNAFNLTHILEEFLVKNAGNTSPEDPRLSKPVEGTRYKENTSDLKKTRPVGVESGIHAASGPGGDNIAANKGPLRATPTGQDVPTVKSVHEDPGTSHASGATEKQCSLASLPGMGNEILASILVLVETEKTAAAKHVVKSSVKSAAAYPAARAVEQAETISDLKSDPDFVRALHSEVTDAIINAHRLAEKTAHSLSKLASDLDAAGVDPSQIVSDPAAMGADPAAMGADPAAMGADPAAAGADPAVVEQITQILVEAGVTPEQIAEIAGQPISVEELAIELANQGLTPEQVAQLAAQVAAEEGGGAEQVEAEAPAEESPAEAEVTDEPEKTASALDRLGAALREITYRK